MEALSKEIYLIAGITVFALLVSIFILLIINTHQKKQRQLHREKTEMEKQFQDTLLRSQLEIQEQTLKHIAQEIHDNIGQTLSLVNINLHRHTELEPEAATASIDTSQQLVGKAIADLRLLSKTLHPDTILAAGLAEAIALELQMIERASGIQTHFEVSEESDLLNSQEELILFRIIQEAFQNAVKHAQARRLSVNLQYYPDSLLLVVEDDGKGMGTMSPPANPLSGSGLRNMRNRVEVLGGNLQFSSAADKGTRLTILLKKQVTV